MSLNLASLKVRGVNDRRFDRQVLRELKYLCKFCHGAGN